MLLNRIKDRKVVLASGSPRRKELLQELGISFEVCVFQGEETYSPLMNTTEIAAHLATQKCKIVAQQFSADTIVIGGDTIVCLDGEILGKPSSETEATVMLKKLSGKTHEVISGIAIAYQNKIYSNFDVAKVHFLPLTDEEITYYVSQFQPLDKAGAYGIQEWIGLKKIDRIEGSFYTIMGLPTALLTQMLENILQ